MAGLFPLHIFPEGALTHSVVTTVWIGVFVTAFFNLRLGWPLSGLVIPGYLVPLLLSRPWSAATVMVEGVLTYFLVWLFSEFLSKTNRWSNLFGRDRFFAMLLASLVVRIAMDGFLLPILGDFLRRELQIDFDYANNLRSFGLIITALIANYFWKPGLRRGMGSLLTVIGLTLVLVRYGLMELTNFNVGRLEYMFEDLGIYFLASPKAYIIIVVTSLIASRMNLKYGWEFGGIMIPSLLALQWYQPVKLVATLLESVIVLGLAVLALKLPVFRNRSIEGARKILLFFNIAFLYRFVLGHVLLRAAPMMQISDVFGFGYLLTTMVAIKMHQRSFLPQMLRSLFQTSLVAVLVASAIGFGLTQVTRWTTPPPPLDPSAVHTIVQSPAPLVERLRTEKLALYQNLLAKSVTLPTSNEIATFSRGVAMLAAVCRGETGESELAQAAKLLATVDYLVERSSDGYLLLRERPGRVRGRGIYVFSPHLSSRGGLIVEVPAPLDEVPSMEAGIWLFLELKGAALAIAGSARKSDLGEVANVLVNPQTLFNAFHRVIDEGNALQVRSLHHQLGRLKPEDLADSGEVSCLWVKKGLPSGLALAGLQKMLRQYRVEWNAPPARNVQRQQSREGFAELFLDKQSFRRARLAIQPLPAAAPKQGDVRTVESYLSEELLARPDEIAPRGSEKYRPFSIEELMYLDQEVMIPLQDLVKRAGTLAAPLPNLYEEVRALDAAAAALGYSLVLLSQPGDGDRFLILRERESATRRHGGTCLIRLGTADPLMIQIPRPLLERNTLEYGVSLLETLRARFLLIAGAHPWANRDGRADMILRGNKHSWFNTISQSILRETRAAPLMVVVCRARAALTDPLSLTGGIFLASSEGAVERGQWSPQVAELVRRLDADGMVVEPVGGQRGTAGYEVGDSPTSIYLPLTASKEMVVLWLPAQLRDHFRPETGKQLEADQFAALGIPTRQVDLFESLAGIAPAGTRAALSDALRSLVESYIRHGDVVLLERLRAAAGSGRLTRWVDRNSRRTFLAIVPEPGPMPVVASLNPRLPETVTIPRKRLTRNAVQRFIDLQAAWLTVTETP